MSDDQPTRVIRTGTPSAPGGTADGGEVTRVIGSGRPGRMPGEPETHVLRGVDQTQAHEGGGVYELTAGWLVVTAGPGRGASREIFFGMNSVGRSPDQRIPLDFGDESISREAHAFIVYDEMQHDFYVQHGGKANLVRLNGKPVLAPAELKHGDILEVGATKLLFVPLCSESFNWSDTQGE